MTHGSTQKSHRRTDIELPYNLDRLGSTVSSHEFGVWLCCIASLEAISRADKCKYGDELDKSTKFFVLLLQILVKILLGPKTKNYFNASKWLPFGYFWA